jgi:hypothetical protein
MSTREEWRNLGFSYDRDDAAKEWRLRGSRDGLLALLVEDRVAAMATDTTSRIREEFAADSTYTLVLELRADTFDPSSSDENLAENAG